VNIFELEIFDNEGSRCVFYTVRWQDTTLSETDKFFFKYKNDATLKRPLQELAKFLEVVIGEENGALEAYFRFENQAQALPPSGTFKVDEVTVNYGNFPLRLYCLRISESLVILFNGGEKTGRTAQEGKTSLVFQEANRFAKKILDAIYQGDIIITSNNREFRSFDGSSEIIL
jgi:hypothetical protein